MTLAENILLGNDAANYARKLITASSTALTTSMIDQSDIAKHIERMRKSTFSTEVSLKDLFRVPDIHFNADLYQIKKAVRLVKNFSVGNCGEYAALALNYLRKQDVKRAEAFSISNGNHCFVVIDRAMDSDPEKPETWGTDAIVCDPWSNKIYPATEITQTLQCYRGIRVNSGEFSMEYSIQNTTYPFDPTIHTLKPDFSIGGNDPETKNRAIQEALVKLQLIKGQLKDDSTASNSLLEQLDKDIDDLIKLSQPNKKETLGIDSNMAFERRLSKIIRGHLKGLLSLAENSDNRTTLTQELIESWINHRGDYANMLPPIMSMAAYSHIFEFHDNMVVLPLIASMSNQELNRLVMERMHIYKGSLLHILLAKNNEMVFITLLSRLDPITVDTITNNGPCSLIDLAINQKSVGCFNALLERHSQPIVDSMVDILYPVLMNLDIESYMSLIDKLSSQQIYTVELLEQKLNYQLEPFQRAIMHLEKTKNSEVKQHVINQLVYLASKYGHVDVIKTLLTNNLVQIIPIISCTQESLVSIARKSKQEKIFDRLDEFLQLNDSATDRGMVSISPDQIAHIMGHDEIVSLFHEHKIQRDLSNREHSIEFKTKLHKQKKENEDDDKDRPTTPGIN